jgi:chromosome segregation ATPase
MRKFDNSITLLENLDQQGSISANDILSILSRVLEEARGVVGKSISYVEVTDEIGFANGIAFLCGQLSETIESHRTMFGRLPTAIEGMFQSDCQIISEEETQLAAIQKQLEAEAEKQKEAEKKKGEVEAKSRILDGEIEQLRKAFESIGMIEADIKAKEVFRDELVSKIETNKAAIAEYQNSLTAAKNAWFALTSQQNYKDILNASGKKEQIVPEVSSFEELQEWFNKFGVSLQDGIAAYTEAYKRLLDALQS